MVFVLGRKYTAGLTNRVWTLRELLSKMAVNGEGRTVNRAFGKESGYMPDIMKQRNKRLELIKRIEGFTGSAVVVYFTPDSPIMGANISEDVLRPMFDHLRSIGVQKRIALYLYSRGGAMEAPWKIVTMLREFCEELLVIVPYKAYSAATMISIGADKILMSRKAELGPIDPALQLAPKEGVAPPKLQDLGVEDVAAYLTFVRERAKITDQGGLIRAVEALSNDLTPPLLGRLERIYSHIRLVARNLLSLHKPPFEDRQIAAITDALTEKLYVHGHGIGRKEAKDIGLDVESLGGKKEDTIWSLYELYEEVFRLRDSLDAEFYFPPDSDSFEWPDTPVACVESARHLHAFVGKLKAERTRRVPSNPTINVNLALNLPGGIDLQQIPQAIQQAIQQLLQQAIQQINLMVAQEIQKQSPVAGISAKFVGGVWKALA
jgi:hypothetical protein